MHRQFSVEERQTAGIERVMAVFATEVPVESRPFEGVTPQLKGKTGAVERLV